MTPAIQQVEWVDRGGLARDLRRSVAGEVRFDEGSRALYANDASLYRQVPLGVVLPRDADDAVAAVAVCRQHGVSILARGCGTGLAGQSVNAGVLFDFSKYMHHIVELDTEAGTARVQPGVICDHLRDAAAQHGLTFAVDPATHDRCTVGGMIGNNSCGTHSMMGGKTVDNIVELDVLTYDGVRMRLGPNSAADMRDALGAGGRRAQIYRDLLNLRRQYAERIRSQYVDIPRRVSGYNLDDLLTEKDFNLARAVVGSESTCVLVLQATVRLLPNPPCRALLVAGYPDPITAADRVPDLTNTGAIALECFDAGVIDNLHKHRIDPSGAGVLPAGGAWLLAEYGANTEREAVEQARQAAEQVREPGVGVVFDDDRRQRDVWEIRRSAIEYARVPGEHSGMAGWEDAAVAPERLGDYLRDYCALVRKYGYHTVLFGHFGQGCVHNRLDLELETAEQVETFQRFLDEAGDAVIRHGGSLSGEHGDGQLRANQLEKMFGPDLLTAFAAFKQIWDPDGKMNPGKVVHPYGPVDNLRQGAGNRPRHVETHFQFPDDERGFVDAVNRCFGVGLCRHTSGGTMCPSFMATRDEEHTTRGRARLLFEMMTGHLGPDGNANAGWRDPHVKEALDLCLACKGCKGDCPVNVDMATYKSEFLAHYYAGRLRPRAAYALGLFPIWAQFARFAPGIANAALHTPGLDRTVKFAAGIEGSRQAPWFAGRTFRDWFRTHHCPEGGQPVMLWPDTFTNHFCPEVGIAAVHVLEDAGFSVRLPERQLCCGRPLYDYGMLPTAKRWLRSVLDELHEPLDDGVPVVGLEPSCLAVFRDELTNLFPEDPSAQRLAAQSVTLAELLVRSGYQPPTLHRRALVQNHCHQNAVIGTEADLELMRAMELTLELPDTGCCGMAGSFGYERGEKYRVATAAGERVLLPKVRDAAEHTGIIADGFSCREQIADGTSRRALHSAQVLDLACENGPAGPAGPLEGRSPKRPRGARALAIAAASAVAVWAWRRSRQ